MIFIHQGHQFAASQSFCDRKMVFIYDHEKLYPTRITEIPYDRDWYEVAQVALTAYLKTQTRRAA